MVQTDKTHPDMFYEKILFFILSPHHPSHHHCLLKRAKISRTAGAAGCARREHFVCGMVLCVLWEGAGTEGSSPDVCLAPTSGSSPRQVLLIRLKGHLHLPRSEKTSPTPWFLPVCRTEPIHCFLNMFICESEQSRASYDVIQFNCFVSQDVTL